MKVQLEIHGGAGRQLERLAAQGILGETIEDVIRAMVCQKLFELHGTAALPAEQQAMEEEDGEKCPRCGSPNLNSLGRTHGVEGTEIQCLDCDARSFIV